MRIKRKTNLKMSIQMVALNRNCLTINRSVTGFFPGLLFTSVIAYLYLSSYFPLGFISVLKKKKKKAPWGKILLAEKIYTFGIAIIAPSLQVSCHQVNRFYKGEMAFILEAAIEKTCAPFGKECHLHFLG